jgi:tetratricopeptide (TPR) repeat protein
MSPNGLTEIPAAAPAAFLVARHFGDATAKAAALEVMRANDMAKDIAPDIYNEGVNATKAGDDAAAEAFFLEAIELDPNLLPAYRAIAAHHFNKQQWAKALPYVDKLLAPLPGSREGQRMGFYSHWELGNKDQAEAHAKAWFALTKDGAEEITQQAEASFEADQSDRARGLSEIVVRNAPDYANGHYLLGRILAGSGDVAGAKRELQRFLELAPDDAEAPAARMMLEGL